jgi:dTDP-glucose 4,6-dehydratase
LAPNERHVLVTGGAGFIGSHLVDQLLGRSDTRVTVLDKLTYAGSLDNLSAHEDDVRFAFVRGDVAEPSDVLPLVANVDHVLHAAAESHVDRSIADGGVFVRTNVLGTQAVLEACRETGTPLLFVDTDEVYGEGVAGGPPFGEDAPLRPRNPYSASKAAADLLCRSYHATYGLPVTIVRGTNAFGPRQHPEKAIPTYTLAALDGRTVPVYGEGAQRREWLFVTDWAAACLAVLDLGEPGGVYNIGGGHELANLDLARTVCRLAGADETLIGFVPDRPGHDFRYGLAWDRLGALGWRPATAFERGIDATIAWFRDHREWADAMRAGASA